MLFGNDNHNPVSQRRRALVAQAVLVGLLAIVTLVLVVMALGAN